MSAKISQAQARWFKKRAETAEATLAMQRNRWSSEYRLGWVNIETLSIGEGSYAKISTARLLGHAVVCVPAADNTNRIMFYADKL